MTARAAQLHSVVLDFDGTIALNDLGDALCDRFAPPSWRLVDDLWEQKRVSLPEAQRRIWALVRATPEAMVAAVDALGTLRPGLDDFLNRVSERGHRLVLASGGFDLYVERLLGARLALFDAVYANRAALVDGGVRIAFPHAAVLGCALCAVCKGAVVDEERDLGRTVTFIGDGTSDRCAVGRGARIVAVRGSKLARHCAAEGAACVEFDDFSALETP